MKILEPYQYRLLGERTELFDKCNKLHYFLESPAFSAVDFVEQSRLVRQLEIMKVYLEVLDERIEDIKV